jgi:hypothetical protein
MKGLEEYLITIDPKYAEGEEDLGIDMIAFVSNPAVKVKGMAFTQSQAKKQFFLDEPKMRIISPALIPMSIYRNDEMGEYYVKFTEQEIEDIYKKFMETLSNYDKFNLEHDEKKIAPAYILESWLVEDPEMDKSRLYDIDVPKGTLMMVAQITDKQYYNDLIKNDRVGFSIEGFLGLKFTQTKSQFMKKKTRRKLFSALAFADGQLAPVGKVTVITEDLKPQEAALVIDETGEPVKNYTGDMLIDETLVTLENGIITEVVTGEEEELEEDPKEEMGLEIGEGAVAGANPEKEKMETEEEELEEVEEELEEVEEVEEVELAIDEAELLTILQPKFDEIYKVIADLKIAVDEVRSHESEYEVEEEEIKMSVAQKLSSALNFLNK